MDEERHDPGAPDWGAVVLSGGRARRLDGTDKAALDSGTGTLLERALAAVAGAAVTVVVGDLVATSRPVRFTRESPVGAGPAAALLRGLDELPATCRVVVVLAVDMPLVTATTVARLRAALTDDVDASVLDDGRRQHLCAAYRVTALRQAAPVDTEGLSVHALVRGLRAAAVPAVTGEADDVDTWADLRDIRARLLHERDQAEQSAECESP